MMDLSELLDRPKAQGFDLYELRRDVEKALNNAKIKVTGAGCGDGKADISIEIGDRQFWIDIKEI